MWHGDPTMHRSENDILFLHRSASFVRQPCLFWYYDSPSGMQCWVPWWHLFTLLRDNNSNLAKRAGVLSGRLPPRVSRAAPEASPPPFVHQGQGTVLSYSHQTVWLEAAADVTVFVFGFVSLRRLFSFPCILSAVAARALGVWVFKKLKKRGLWKRSWGLGSCTSWIGVFFVFFFLIFFAFTAKSTE